MKAFFKKVVQHPNGYHVLIFSCCSDSSIFIIRSMNYNNTAYTHFSFYTHFGVGCSKTGARSLRVVPRNKTQPTLRGQEGNSGGDTHSLICRALLQLLHTEPELERGWWGTDMAHRDETGRWRKIGQNPRKNAEHFPQVVHITDDTRATESLLRGVLLQRKSSLPRLSKIHSRHLPPTHHLLRAYESKRR